MINLRGDPNHDDYHRIILVVLFLALIRYCKKKIRHMIDVFRESLSLPSCISNACQRYQRMKRSEERRVGKECSS